MNMTGGQHPSERKDEQTAIQKIIEAKEQGRKIVPFLGAGISASSGFPLVDAIRQYLLKVRYFIQYGAYRDALGLSDDISSSMEDPESAKVPEQNPSRYLTDFGWPNPNQLNSDLHRVTGLGGGDGKTFDDLERWIGAGPAGGKDPRGFLKSVGAAAQALGLKPEESPEVGPQAWIDHHVAKTFQSQVDDFRSLVESPSRRDGSKIDWYDELRKLKRLYKYAAISRKKFAKWGRPRWRIMTAALFAQLEDIRLYDQRLAEAIEEQIWRLELAPTTDWSRHLMQLAEGNLNLIDALFSMLGLRYAPGLSHRMMAQLVKSLNLSLLLTINFDPYLEEALMEEGITPRVLDVSRDDDPPDVTVVKQAMSIIKLHGSSHSIRLGERLDYALDDDTRHRVERFVGDDALLLILGFSGYERRMMQLIDHLATRNGPGEQLRVLWMHFEAEDRLPATLIDFERRLADQGRSNRFFRTRLSDAGEFLFHVHQRAMGSYPRVRVPVTILPKRVVELPDPRDLLPTNIAAENRDAYEENLRHLDEMPAQLFVEEGLLADNTSGDAVGQQSVGMLESSRRLSRFVQQKSGYQLIWIDLEEHHTVAGVITEIIDRMRVFDPDLSPLILPVEKPASRKRNGEAQLAADLFTKPIRFLKRALRRGRYLLAFDSLEDFGREQTSHHGLPSDFSQDDKERKRKLLGRVDDLLLFLSTLLEVDPVRTLSSTDDSIWNLDWYCAIACSIPQPRHDFVSPADRKNSVVTPVREKLRRFVQNVIRTENRSAAFVLADRGETAKIVRFRPKPKLRIVVHKMRHPRNVAPKGRPSTARGEAPPDRALTQWVAEASLRAVKGSGNLDKTQKEIDDAIENFFGSLLPRSERDSSKPVTAWLDGPSGFHLLPFLTLTVTRRPRSYVGIRTLWSEYLSPDWKVTHQEKKCTIDAVLESLESAEVLKAMPGGFYWIPHRLHRKAYKLLSDPVRRKNLKDGERQNDPELQPLLFRRIVFLILVHGRLARFYYLHVFLRTRDANAMFEYLYHRITCLKYLASLCEMTKHIRHRSPDGGSLSKASAQACRALLHLEGHGELEDEGNQATIPPREDGDDLEEQITALRERWLQALTNVFDREKEMFLSQGSADTWLAWIEQILGTDLERLVSRHEESDGASGSSLIRLRERLGGKLEDLQATLLREKRDWEECANRRNEHLTNWCRAFAKKLAPHSKSKDSEKLREILEDPGLLVAQIRLIQNQNPTQRSDLVQWLGKVFEGQMSWAAGELLEGAERLLRCLEDLARCIHHDPWMKINGSQVIESGSLQNHPGLVPEQLLAFARIVVNELRKYAIQSVRAEAGTGGDISRPLLAMAQAWDVNIIFEQTRLRFGELSLLAGGIGKKLRQKLEKACQTLERARHRTRGFDSISPVEFPLSRSRLRTLQAQMLINLDRSQEARLALSHAETGLTEETMQQRFQLAVVAEFRAQTWMKEADRTLNECEANENGLATAIERARASKKAAGHRDEAVQALRDAERLLQRGRRNAGQWLRLYTAKAQLEIENLLLMLFDMDGDISAISIDSELHFRAKLYNILQRGLEAIRGGWDCVQAPAKRGSDKSPEEQDLRLVKKERSSWLVKWAQLMMTGHLVLHRYSRVLLLQELRSKKSNDKESVDGQYRRTQKLRRDQRRIAAVARYKELWIALNKSVSLDHFVLKDSGSPEREPAAPEGQSGDDVRCVMSTWEALLKSGTIYAKFRIRDRIAWRQLAKEVVGEMVGRNDKQRGSHESEQDYRQRRKAALKLKKKYEVWRDFRIRGGLH